MSWREPQSPERVRSARVDRFFVVRSCLSQVPGENSIYSHIRPQRLGNHDGPVGLLIGLNDRHPRASNRQAASVQSMDKLGLTFSFAPEANIRTPRLESLEVRAGRNLAEELLPRKPHFQIVSLS